MFGSAIVRQYIVVIVWYPFNSSRRFRFVARSRDGQRFGLVEFLVDVRGAGRRGTVGRTQQTAEDQRGAGGRKTRAAAVQQAGELQEPVPRVQRVLAKTDQRVRGDVQKVSRYVSRNRPGNCYHCRRQLLPRGRVFAARLSPLPAKMRFISGRCDNIII